MRTRASLALLATVFLAPAPARAAGEPLRLDAPTKIDALKIADVDGDGRADVVTLSSRTVCVWLAGKDAAPSSAPKWKVDLPPDVSFVDVARSERPALVGLGATGAMLLRLDRTGDEAQQRLPDARPLGWHGGSRAVFANLHPGPVGNPTFVLPTVAGLALMLPGRSHETILPLNPRNEVTAAGPFLEDVAVVTSAVPALSTFDPGAPADPDAAVWEFWHVGEDALVLQIAHRIVLHQFVDLAFLPTSGERRLADLDGNGTPDLIHRDGDNREGRYAFFRVPPPGVWERDPQKPENMVPNTKPPNLRPPAAYLRLAGFNLDPDYVDADGDKLVDFVVTTMALDGPNIFRAVATGKVTATTLAFLQRKQAPNVPMFPTQPDAVVTSEIGVKIRFAHTGTIDVSRSFTILATGDLDGDGRRDLVIRSGPSTLQVRKGTADGVWAKDATTVTIPAVGPGEECEATAANLDGRPGDEILLLYRGADTAPDRLYLLKP